MACFCNKSGSWPGAGVCSSNCGTGSVDPSAVAFVVDRWAARLSALLIRGTALVAGEALPPAAPLRAEDPVSSGGLPDVCPEGASTYELLVR